MLALMNAAIKLFSGKGFNNTSVDELARSSHESIPRITKSLLTPPKPRTGWRIRT